MVEAYLKQGEVSLKLPLPPTTLPMKLGMTNKTLNLLNYGEVTAIGKPKQFTITYTSLFPTSAVKHTVRGLKPPNYYTNAIIKMMNTQKPVTLSIVGTSFGNIQLLVSIDEFNPTQRTGKSGIIDYTITFKEYRTVTSKYLQTIELPPLPTIPYNPLPPKEEEDNKSQAEVIKQNPPYKPTNPDDSMANALESIGVTNEVNYSVVENGERFVDIVKKHYGSTDYVIPVGKYNKHILNVGYLTKGTVVKLPPVSKLQKVTMNAENALKG